MEISSKVVKSPKKKKNKSIKYVKDKTLLFNSSSLRSNDLEIMSFNIQE